MNSEWSGYASRRNSSSSPPSQGSVAAAFALANVAKGSTVPVSPAIMREVGLHTAIARHRSASIGGASAESLKPVYDNISKLEDQIIKLHSDIEQLREDLDDRDTAIEALKEERDKTKLEAQVRRDHFFFGKKGSLIEGKKKNWLLFFLPKRGSRREKIMF